MAYENPTNGQVWKLAPGHFRAFLPMETSEGKRELLYKDCGSWSDACEWLRGAGPDSIRPSGPTH